MLWACFVLPHLAMDGVLRQQPDQAAANAQPLVLVGRVPAAAAAAAAAPGAARQVLAVNEPARAAGLFPGQRLVAAQALLARFKAVECSSGMIAGWQELLAAWAYRYSAEVVTFPGAVALEVGRSLALFGPWPAFEQRLRQDLAGLGFRPRLAVAPAPRAAWLLAGSGDGVVAGDPALLARALAQVPVQRAHLPGGVTESLVGMGITRLGQLLALPRASLRSRFGTELTGHLERLLGERPDPLPLYRPPDCFDAVIELGQESVSRQALLFPLRRLTADLAAFLAGRDGGVQHFLLELLHERSPATPVAVGLQSVQRDPAVLFELARARLEQATVSRPVLGLRLLATGLPEFRPAARDLFDGRPAHALPLPQLRERLRARLGADALYRLALTADPRPEHAQTRAGDSRLPELPERLPRPTWLLARPIPLRGPAPHLLAGPERIETGWWDGGDIRRDYYVAETGQGQRAWVFCAPGEQGPWMLHGWFA